MTTVLAVVPDSDTPGYSRIVLDAAYWGAVECQIDGLTAADDAYDFEWNQANPAQANKDMPMVRTVKKGESVPFRIELGGQREFEAPNGVTSIAFVASGDRWEAPAA